MTVQEPPVVRKLTHYQVLKLDPSVDDEVLTEVYRRLIQRAHLADLDEKRRIQVLRAIERAYAVLHDPVRRRRYDLELTGRAEAAPTVGEYSDRVPVAVPRAMASSDSAAPGHAAAPVTARASTPTPGSRILDFGRYAGWSLRQIALRDRDYLEWLRRTPLGRRYQAEIASILPPR
jgi:hypothetical protein